ncbi:MAG: AbrB/MazE/SpoVT family DNA-binding domain-containing protein [Pseudoxanthomonas sp.]
MQSQIRQWGNSAALRLPASTLDTVNLAVDAKVDVKVEKGRIVVKPLRSDADDLADLAQAITAENLHESIDFGAPAGKETL